MKIVYAIRKDSEAVRNIEYDSTYIPNKTDGIVIENKFYTVDEIIHYPELDRIKVIVI